MKRLILLCLCLSMFLLACATPVANPKTEEPTKPAATLPEEASQSQNNTVATEATVDPSLVGKTFACGDYEYIVQSDGTVYISCYFGTDIDHTVPIEIDGYAVTGIAKGAYSGNDMFESLVIPGQIKFIGEDAFFGCDNLAQVTLDDGVESIGRGAFNSCDNIQSFSLTSSVCKISEYAWSRNVEQRIHRYSNGLRYVGNVAVGFADDFDGHFVFEKDTVGIKARAFTGAKVLDKTVELPEGLRCIGYAAFALQPEIMNYIIPASVEEIESCAVFSGYWNGTYDYYDSKSVRKIYGVEGSAAERFANENGFTFVITSG